MNTKREDSANLCREDFDGGPVSLDEIEDGLFLGNLTAATSMETLKAHKITHILTLDSVPLPSHIVEASFLTTCYIQISDMPKEDILHSLDKCTEFISSALNNSQNVLVHCYFGVSRSSTAVIAYIMKAHNMEYNQAFELVKSKRRFVQPNAGFVFQLKLYRRMGCHIDPDYQRYKTYRLKLAAENVRKAKILPQSYMDVVKRDPALIQENPEPIVYRCRKCRRIVASKSNIMPHSSNEQATGSESKSHETTSSNIPNRLINEIAEKIRKSTLTESLSNENNECKSVLFVEPIAWMKSIFHNSQGRLNCPKCEQKLGSFSWINGCHCPCGTEVSPAFYLISSRIELSKAVQNLQTTV